MYVIKKTKNQGRTYEIISKSLFISIFLFLSAAGISFNVRGDFVPSFEIKNQGVEDLGTISSETRRTLDTSFRGTRKYFSFTPSAGKSKGTKIYFGLHSEYDYIDKVGKTNFRVMITRSFDGDNRNTLVEVGGIKSNTELKSVEVTLTPEGIMKVKDPIKPLETITFDLGKK